MSENIEKAPNVPPFVRFVASAVPMVFDDSMSYYEALSALWKYMQDTVDIINNNATVTEEYIQLTDQMKEYMDNYFNNLDVQEEINNKLDELVADGTIPDILNERLTQISNDLTNEVNRFESQVGSEIDVINAKVESIIGITPTVVSSTDQMVDTSKIYVVTATNKWYYYASGQWNEGGDYNSDAGESLIQWYLDNISNTGGNLLDPLACKDNTSMASATGAESSNANFWVTDFIPVEPVAVANVGYFIGCVTGINNVIPSLYKVLIFDENQEVLSSEASILGGTVIRVSNETLGSSTKYLRIQFRKSDFAFDNRQNLIISSGLPGYKTAFEKTYYYVDENSIKNSGTSIFKEDIANEFASILINHTVFPFTENDVSYATIASANGLTYYYNRTRICFDRLIKVNHGIRFVLTNGWSMLAMEFAKDGTYVGRYGADWSSDVTITRDSYLKFVFKQNDAEIDNITSVRNLLANITISTFIPATLYYGEKIDVNNTFSSSATNIVGLHQDGASYENTIIFCNQDGKYKVYNSDGAVLHEESYIAAYSQFLPHFNSLCFGTEKFAEGDNYPLLYGNAYNNTALPKGALYAYRLKNDYTTEYKQRIVVGFTEDAIWAGDGTNVRPYGNFVIDTDNNYLYAFTMIDSLNVTRFFKFNMPTMAQGDDVALLQSDIIEYFDVPYEAYIQGCCYHNGKIYSLSGFGTSEAPARMHVIDLVSKTEVSEVPLGAIEPEAVYVNNGKLYIGQTTMSQYLFN